jgi:hypothetical protein
LLFALLLPWCVGCGSSPVGSCRLNINGNNVCVDCVGPNLDSNLLRTHCGDRAGTWSAAACPTTRRVGRCEIPTSAVIVSTHYYSPLTLDVARATCNQPGWYFIRE